MDSIDRLARLFEKFPGIGPRQAQRFVQYLLRTSPSIRREIADGIRELNASVHQCPSCMRFSSGSKGLCGICTDTAREPLLAVVASDADLLALERSHTFHGRYYVLGGLISLASEDTRNLRLHELTSSLQGRIDDGLTEIVLAFPANPEGDATAARVRDELATAVPSLTVTTLGRGLSTGSELEYADPDTLRSALANRK